MPGRREFDDFELLAYADGLLDGEPERKAKVEARLSAHAEDAARVQAWRSQTEALHRRYGGVADEPVPDNLLAALERPRGGPGGRRFAALGAVAGLLAVAGGSGWMLGQRGEPVAWSAQRFLDRSYAVFAGERPATGGDWQLAQAGDVEPINWLSDRISLTLRAPDLSGLGYAMVGKQIVQGVGGRMVRLEYAAPDGRGFSLFLRGRWEDSDPDLRVANRDGVSMAYWLDGPLASAVVSRLAPDEARRVAEHVRRMMLDPDMVEPGKWPDGAERPAADAAGQPAGTATSVGIPVPHLARGSEASAGGPDREPVAN